MNFENEENKKNNEKTIEFSKIICVIVGKVFNLPIKLKKTNYSTKIKSFGFGYVINFEKSTFQKSKSSN